MSIVLEEILNGVSNGNIEKNTAVRLIKEIKNMNINEDKNVAVIGISLNFPFAQSKQEFWKNIINGIDCISEFPESRNRDIKKYIKYKKDEFKTDKFCKGAYLKHIDGFDYNFFRISPKEAKLMDPCQRIFLEEAWHAIEDSGYSPEKIRGSNTGVFIGFANTIKDSYQKIIYDVCPEEISTCIIGNLPAIIPSRISYLLDFEGPSIMIDTACSSSLVAIHTACKSIINKECDMAIAGGVKCHTVPIDDENMKTGVESRTGHTRAFDNTTDGAGIGEGSAVIVLKRLQDAVRDRDNIYAVIKGSAVNQDGNSINISAPNPTAQSKVIIKAWKDANINPETIDYIQTHGTGTILGDPIEIRGIEMAFKKYTDKKQFCAIHSVKSNIGHLYECSGMSNILTAISALNNNEIPKEIYFNTPNKKILFENTPVYVNTRRRKWDKPENHPRRCGVSAFGFSGTNCHLVLEEAPQIQLGIDKKSKMNNILKISAKTESALNKYIKDYYEFIEKSDESLDNICYTANIGRDDYNYRSIFIYDNKQELLDILHYVLENGLENMTSDKIFYGHYKIIPSIKKSQKAGELNQLEKDRLTISLNEQLNRYLDGNDKNRSVLISICRIFVKGGDINWSTIYNDTDYRRVSIPVYPFENKRCWIDIPEESSSDNIYYRMTWTESSSNNICKVDLSNENILVLKSENRFTKKFLSKLKSSANKVIEITIGKEFKKIGEYEYTSQINSNFSELADLIEKEKITKVIHISSLNDEEEVYDLDLLRERHKYASESLFGLIKSIGLCRNSEEISLSIVSDHINKVTKSDIVIKPENAPLVGLNNVLRKEYPDLRSNVIDIDVDTEINEVIIEVFDDDQSKGSVAYRKGKRYIPCFDSINEKEYKSCKLSFSEKGIYIITGGTGDIGLEFAKYLSSKGKVNIALVSRSGFCERTLWDKEKDKYVYEKINNIREIESNGSKIYIYKTDISNEEHVIQFINKLLSEFGKINGIIHAAGITGDTLISDMSLEEFNSSFEAKMYGTWILDKVTQNLKMDFMLLFSSIATIFSSPGQGNYAAANAYMDSFAAYRNAKGMKTLTINWSTWKEIGMSVRFGVNIDTLYKALMTNEAIKAFDNIVNKDLSNVLIGHINKESRYIKQIENFGFNISGNILEKLPKINGETVVKTKKKKINADEIIIVGEKNISQTEKKLARIWGEILGIDTIDIYDSFYDLGGDSILGMSLIKEIKKKFPSIPTISVAEVFTLSTFTEMVTYIESKLCEKVTYSNDEILVDIVDEYDEIKIKCFDKGMFQSNSYVVYRNSIGIIIDAGVRSADIIKFIKENNLTIKYIFLTHAHVDHMLFIKELSEELKVPVMIHENEKALLKDNDGLVIVEQEDLSDIGYTYLKDGEQIEADRLRIEIILTPGHTQGSICLRIENLLFTGDTLFKLAVGGPDSKYGNDASIKDSVVNKILTLDDNIIIYPGHGESTTVGFERQNNKFTIYKIKTILPNR